MGQVRMMANSLSCGVDEGFTTEMILGGTTVQALDRDGILSHQNVAPISLLFHCLSHLMPSRL